MVKSVSSALLTDIRSNVQTLATCVEIIRKDGQVLRLTTHDTDLTIEGDVYRHDVPFVLSAIQSGSNFAVDNAELTLFADDENVYLSDVKAKLFEYAAVRIFQVNYEDVTHGIVTLRKGWFGPISAPENRIINFTITGLLKVLDLEIGHIFAPVCDADFGDKRCKVAVDQSQVRSPLSPYTAGDWAYYYDESLATAITVVNPSFEADGARTTAQAITGWTRAVGSKVVVSADGGSTGTFGPLDGTYLLRGDAADDVDQESAVYQDIDLAAGGLDATDIDDGKLSMAYFCGLLQGFELTDFIRIKMDIIDATGSILDTVDTRYIALDAVNSWRERGLVMSILPGARTARLWIYFLNASGSYTNCAADRVKLFWWDHTLGNPYSNVVYQLTRIAAFGTDAIYYMTNPSFENNGNVANANNPIISAWTTGVGNWWTVGTALYGLTPQDGLRFIGGGNDGGSTQREYVTTQTKRIIPPAPGFFDQSFKLDPARVLLGKYTGHFHCYVGWGDTTSAATVKIEFLDSAGTSVVGTYTPMTAQLGTVGWVSVVEPITIPTTAVSVRVTLKAKSPTGSGNAKVAFDNVYFKFYDAERPLKSDPASGFGDVGTVFSTATGTYTADNQLVWKAVSAFARYDVVASVVDAKKTFTGTDIAGSAGTFETAGIRWISGANAGLKNIIRKWDSGTKTLKLYFTTPHPIQVGDRFLYSRACQRRFIEDCQLTFSNTVNFRGFPHLPGRLTS